MKRILVALVALLVLASTAWAQSLAELAKKEEERRKALKQPAKVLTNEDLKKFGRVTPLEPPKTDAAAARDPAAADAAAGDAAKVDATRPDAAKTDADKPKDQEPVKDEAWWRNRITEARAALERNRLLADALQSRINQLWADFTARDDPQQRKLLGEERVRAIDELERLKKAMEAQKKGITDIETEARQAGVPPGWLR
jgi:hypothetical protein